jgi:hypothetical protein
LEDEDDAVEETYCGRFRVSPGKLGPLIYKVPFVGLYKLKVQLNYGLHCSIQKREKTVGKYKGKQKRFITIQEK